MSSTKLISEATALVKDSCVIFEEIAPTILSILEVAVEFQSTMEGKLDNNELSQNRDAMLNVILESQGAFEALEEFTALVEAFQIYGE